MMAGKEVISIDNTLNSHNINSHEYLNDRDDILNARDEINIFFY